MIRYTVKKNAYYQGFMSSETPKILTKEAVVNCSKIIRHDFVFNSGMIPEVFHVFFWNCIFIFILMEITECKKLIFPNTTD